MRPLRTVSNAATIGSLIACAVLAGLWLWSYHQADEVLLRARGSDLSVTASCGRVGIGLRTYTHPITNDPDGMTDSGRGDRWEHRAHLPSSNPEFPPPKWRVLGVAFVDDWDLSGTYRAIWFPLWPVAILASIPPIRWGTRKRRRTARGFGVEVGTQPSSGRFGYVATQEGSCPPSFRYTPTCVMSRHAFNVISALSLLACLAAACFWWRDVGYHVRLNGGGVDRVYGPNAGIWIEWSLSETTGWVWTAPYSTLFWTASGTPFLWAYRRARSRRRLAGLCGVCGYDLRAPRLTAAPSAGPKLPTLEVGKTMPHPAHTI